MNLQEVIERPAAVLTAVCLVDLGALVLGRNDLAGEVLKEWYDKFGVGAFISDVGSICFGIFLALFLFQRVFSKGSFTLFHFMVAVVGIQLTHDLLFGWIINHYPARSNRMMDVFKSYVNEKSWKILLVDATMMMLSVLLIKWLITLDNIAVYTLLAFTLYFAQYLIFS